MKCHPWVDTDRVTPATPGDQIATTAGVGADGTLPSAADPLVEPKKQRVGWSLSWPTVAAGLAGMAAVAVVAIVGADDQYQQSQDESKFLATPIVSAVLTVHVWRAIGVLVPLAIMTVLFSVSFVLVVNQRRKSESVASPWRRVLVGMATGSLAVVGLGVVAASLFGAVTGTRSVWIVRTAGSVIGILVVAAAIYVMVSTSFRPPVRATAIGLVILAALVATVQWTNTTGNPEGNSWSGSGFVSMSLVGRGMVYFSADCPAPGTCLVQGLGFGPTTETIATTNGGDTWSRRAAGPWPLTTEWLSCWDADHCMGARGGTSITSDGGRSWRKATVPSTFASESVECSAPETCMLVGTHDAPFTNSGVRGLPTPEVLLTHDGGSTWLQGLLPSGSEDLYSVACSSLSRCFATGTITRDTTSPGVILESEDGGLTWTQTALPSDVPLLSQMACSDASHCVAVGSTRTSGVPQTSTAVWTSDGGTTWNRSTIPGNNNVVRVACIRVLTCLAAGQGSQRLVLFETNDGGATWSDSPSQFPRSNSLLDSSLALSCAQDGFCMLVSGTYAATSTDGGTTWKEHKERQSGLPV